MKLVVGVVVDIVQKKKGILILLELPNNIRGFLTETCQQQLIRAVSRGKV